MMGSLVWLVIATVVVMFIMRPGCPAYMHDHLTACDRCGWHE